MPKVKDYRDPAPALILSAAARRFLEVPDLIKRSGIKRSTMYNRMKNPGHITLEELRALDRASGGIPDEDVLTIVRWRG